MNAEEYWKQRFANDKQVRDDRNRALVCVICMLAVVLLSMFLSAFISQWYMLLLILYAIPFIGSIYYLRKASKLEEQDKAFAEKYYRPEFTSSLRGNDERGIKGTI